MITERTRYFEATFTNGLLATRPMATELRPMTKGPQEDGVIPQDEIDGDTYAQEELKDEINDRGVTAFARDENGQPGIWSYMLRGFLKSAIGNIGRDKTTECSKIKAHKKVINGCVFVEPRFIPLQIPSGSEMSWCQRPLRAQTLQGERVAIATSEEAPAGTKIRFSIKSIVPGLDSAIDECFQLAKYTFLGQWRNSGKGTAVIEEVKPDK